MIRYGPEYCSGLAKDRIPTASKGVYKPRVINGAVMSIGVRGMFKLLQRAMEDGIYA